MKKIKDAFSFSRSMKINAGYKSMLGLIILIDDICASLLCMVRSKYHSRLFDLALIGACIFFEFASAIFSLSLHRQHTVCSR